MDERMRLTAYVERPQGEAIEAAARADEVSVSALVRRIIREHLADRAAKAESTRRATGPMPFEEIVDALRTEARMQKEHADRTGNPLPVPVMDPGEVPWKVHRDTNNYPCVHVCGHNPEDIVRIADYGETYGLQLIQIRRNKPKRQDRIRESEGRFTIESDPEQHRLSAEELAKAALREIAPPGYE